ncbi:MAG: ribbon-helix-helix domain-containing protein [Candidatus Acidiferrales bacterium]
MRKIRTVIYLEKEESELLKKLSERTGAKITELARRAIAEYLKRQKGK